MSSTAIATTDLMQRLMVRFYQGIESSLRAERVLRANDPAPRFWVLPLQGRAVFVLDIQTFHAPLRKISSSGFRARLERSLDGRPVVITALREGMMLQIGWDPRPTYRLPEKAPFKPRGSSPNLTVPLGLTRKGPSWCPLHQLEAVLIGGTRQRGKTMLLHTWIVAMLQNAPEKVQLYLHDGKDKIKFGIYEGAPQVAAVTGSGEELVQILSSLREKLQTRGALMADRGVQHIRNLTSGVRPPYIVLIVDEVAIAMKTDGVQELLVDLVTRGGDYGIIPIIVSHQTSGVLDSQTKMNLGARICFYVPDGHISQNILGAWGAEKLPNTPGRYLVKTPSGLHEVQGFYLSDADIQKAASQATGAQIEDLRPTPPPLTLSEQEVQVIQAAVRADLYLSPQKIADETGLSRRWISRKVKQWIAEGLVEPSHNTAQGRVSARCKQRLLRLANIPVAA